MVVVDHADGQILYLLRSRPRHQIDHTNRQDDKDDRQDNVSHHLFELFFDEIRKDHIRRDYKRVLNNFQETNNSTTAINANTAVSCKT